MNLADHLINHATGELDLLVIAECAELRACREWGGPNPSPLYLRTAATWCMDRARAMRAAWRSQRGLPSDEPVTMMDVPTWGDSGDSFSGERNV